MTVESDSSEARWYCVRTQIKREHIATRMLRMLDGVEVCCPRIRYRKATRRGKIWWVEPMFPGYVMARFSLAEMERQVTSTQGVSRIIRFGKEIPAIPEPFIQAIRSEIQSHDASPVDECITLTPALFQGDEVEVANGPLRGMQGTVIEILPSIERVKILLEFLGQPNVIEIDLFALLLPRKPVPNNN